MKVLITGIAGFIGFHTALYDLAMKVIRLSAFDNFNSYYDPTLKYKRSAKLAGEHDIVVEHIDLKDKDGVVEFVKQEKPDLVIHLAAMAGVRYSMDNPQEYIDNNVTGTLNLIIACEESWCRERHLRFHFLCAARQSFTMERG